MQTTRGDVHHDFEFVTSLLKGEDGEKIVVDAVNKAEVKRDFGAGYTKAVFVEHRSWNKPSGIAISEADYWIFLLDGAEYEGEVFIGIKTDRLRKVMKNLKWELKGGQFKASTGTPVKLSRLIWNNTQIDNSLNYRRIQKQKKEEKAKKDI